MKKLILIGIGLAGAGAFIGFDAVHAFASKARHDVRSALMSPELELQAQIGKVRTLSKQCADSVVNGQMALARLDSMIAERDRETGLRNRRLDRDRRILKTRQGMLGSNRAIYLIGGERVSRRTLNRDAVLRAKSFSTDREILAHIERTVSELKAQRRQTSAEIENASLEMGRLGEEVKLLKAELENLRARKAVAQSREEAKYVFDRSAFDRAREKIGEIRATIAQQNRQLDFFGRNAAGRRGLIPADLEMEEAENGADAIATALSEGTGDGESDEEASGTDGDVPLALRRDARDDR